VLNTIKKWGALEMWTEADFRAVNFQPITPKQLALLNKLEFGYNHSGMSLEEASKRISALLEQQSKSNHRRAVVLGWKDKIQMDVDWYGNTYLHRNGVEVYLDQLCTKKYESDKFGGKGEWDLMEEWIPEYF
jgi:hypothetical protein